MTALDIVILTSMELAEPAADDISLTKALEDEGLRVGLLNWEEFDPQENVAVLFRSTWGYTHKLGQFKKFLKALAQSRVRVWNPLPLIRWNLKKTYLFELASEGHSVIPSLLVERKNLYQLSDLAVKLESESLVIKPVIGARAEGAIHLELGDPLEPIVTKLLQTEAEQFLLQAFVSSVRSEGEYSLIFIDQQFSHCVLKKPPENDFRVQDGIIQKVSTPPSALKVSESLVNSLAHEALYARVDLVRASDGNFLLMELELIEPDLFLSQEPQSVLQFASAISKQL